MKKKKNNGRAQTGLNQQQTPSVPRHRECVNGARLYFYPLRIAEAVCHCILCNITAKRLLTLVYALMVCAGTHELIYMTNVATWDKSYTLCVKMNVTLALICTRGSMDTKLYFKFCFISMRETRYMKFCIVCVITKTLCELFKIPFISAHILMHAEEVNPNVTARLKKLLFFSCI